MPTTQRELTQLLHKTLTTRPTDCPIRQLVAWLAKELASAKGMQQMDGTSGTRVNLAQVLVLNVAAEQAAVFGGQITNN